MNYVQQFENVLLKSTGNNFQDYFYRLMKEKDADFTAIKSYGSAGDAGCDGYVYASTGGVYFQVYGPEEPYNKSSLSHARTKIKSDFWKLHNFIQTNNSFPQISSYIFVFNNKSDATISMEISTYINDLKEQFKNIIFNIWDIQHLIKEFQSLCVENQMRIVGIYPDNNFANDVALTKWENEDIIEDINIIRKYKEWVQKLLRIIDENNFVAPFPIEILHLTSELTDELNSTIIRDTKTEEIKDTVIENITVLGKLIMEYTRFIPPCSGVMKRIEPGGEIDNENFFEVQEKMLSARKNAYFSLEKFMEQEDILRRGLST